MMMLEGSRLLFSLARTVILQLPATSIFFFCTTPNPSIKNPRDAHFPRKLLCDQFRKEGAAGLAIFGIPGHAAVMLIDAMRDTGC